MKNVIDYIDMGNVAVNCQSAFPHIAPDLLARQEARETVDAILGILSLMEPVARAVEAFETIASHFDTYILWTLRGNIHRLGQTSSTGSRNSWESPHNGARFFRGEHIVFGREPFPDWKAVTDYLLPFRYWQAPFSGNC